MTLTVANAKKMLICSSYPLDKVIYMTSGSATTSSYSVTVTITHGLGFIPLPYIQWSLNSNFAVCYESLERTSDLYPPSFPYYSHLYATSTTVKFDFSKVDFTGSQVTIYYRLICFAPYGNTSDVTKISNLADNFVLNTDYNYTKLYTSGAITTTSEPQSVAHSLGYVPQVMCWLEASSTITPLPYSIIYAHASAGLAANGYGRLNITTSNLVFNKAGKYHYRVYLDI